MQNKEYAARARVLAASDRLAKQINPVQPAMIEPLVKANEELKQDLAQIRQYVGQYSWSLLMEGKPSWFGFQGRYRQAVNSLAVAAGGTRLTATDMPAILAGGPIGGTVLIGTRAFQTQAAVQIDVAVAPTIENVALQQMQAAHEDWWLMDDLVKAIAATNQTHFKQLGIESPKVSDSVIKEIVQIEIGAAFAQPRRAKSVSASAQNQRYLTVSRSTMAGAGMLGGGGMSGGGSQDVGRDTQALTITGHASNNNEGKYNVLPFRMLVVADAGNYLELVRQLPFNRSLITVLNVSYTLIADTEAEYKRYNLTVTTLEEREKIYGTRPLAIVEIVGESLIFVDPAVRPILGGTAAPVLTGM